MFTALAPARRRRWALLAEARRADAREHWAGAARAYEALRGLFPDDVEAQLDLARTYTAAGELDRADAALAGLRALTPDDAGVELAAAAVAAERGDVPAELAAAERAVGLATAAAAPVAAAFAEVVIAEVAAQQGDLDRADAALARAVPVLEAGRQCARLARAHRDRGDVAWRRGQLERARAATEQGLEVATRCHDRRGQVSAQAALGLVAGARGDHAASVAQLTAALAGYRALRADAQVAWALQALGNAAFARLNCLLLPSAWKYLENRSLRIRHPHAIGQGEAIEGGTQTKSSGLAQSIFALRGTTQDSVNPYSK